MANVNEGLETPPAGESVNSQAGFDAALAGKGIEPEEGETSEDTSIASGLETVEPGVARGPDGKFVAKAAAPAKPETPVQQQDTSADADQQVTSDDPEVAAYLERYNGDPAAALKAAANQSSVLGRQGQELGTLRETVAELRGMVTALTATTAAAASPATVYTDEQIEERAGGLIQSKGYSDAATDAANLSLQPGGDERLLRSIYEQWSIEDPWEANNFLADFRAFQRTSALQPAAKEDPFVENLKADVGIDLTIKTLAAELGDAWAHAAPKMGEALDAMPPQVGAMIADEDPAIRLAGARLVADRATLLAGAPAPTTEQDTENDDMPDSVKRKLLGSSVATAGLRPAPAAPAGQETKEEAIAAFKQGILEAETTSVASGLTFGAPAPGR